MRKTDKKIISILLILIILISQCGTIFAIDLPTTGGLEFTLEEFLIKSGVDKNDDGILSEEEWKSVKNLIIEGSSITDLSGFENATNLEELYISEINLNGVIFPNLNNLKSLSLIDVSDLRGIDFSKMTKLAYLYCENISDCGNVDFSELCSLEDLYINKCNNVKFNSIGNLELKSLTINDFDLSEIDFSKFYNVKDITLLRWNNSFEKQVDLDLTGMNCLENLYISDINPYYINYDNETDTQSLEWRGGNYINSLDISKLPNLKYLSLNDTYSCEIKYPDFTKIETISVDTDKVDAIDLTNLKNYSQAYITTIGDSFNNKNIKINENMIVDCYSSGRLYLYEYQR